VSDLRNKTAVSVFYRGDKVLVLVLVRVIKSLVHEKKQHNVTLNFSGIV